MLMNGDYDALKRLISSPKCDDNGWQSGHKLIIFTLPYPITKMLDEYSLLFLWVMIGIYIEDSPKLLIQFTIPT